MRMTLLVWVVIGVCSGCASTPPSRAMTIAKAAGIEEGLRDIPKDKFIQAFQVNEPSKTPGLVLAGGTATKAFSAPSAVGAAGGTAILLLGTLMTGQAVAASRNNLVAWFPEAELSSVSTIKELAPSLVIDAFLKALPDTYSISVGEPYSYGQRRVVGVFEKKTDFRAFNFFVGWMGGSDKKSKAPEFLGGYPSRHANGSVYFFSYLYNAESKPVDFFSLYARMSESLPAHGFIYLTPHDDVTAAPVVLDHGKIEHFVTGDPK